MGVRSKSARTEATASNVVSAEAVGSGNARDFREQGAAYLIRTGCVHAICPLLSMTFART
jgi:hypothetical protein